MKLAGREITASRKHMRSGALLRDYLGGTAPPSGQFVSPTRFQVHFKEPDGLLARYDTIAYFPPCSFLNYRGVPLRHGSCRNAPGVPIHCRLQREISDLAHTSERNVNAPVAGSGRSCRKR